MKNIIIALLTTYIFWMDIAVVHPLPVLPFMFVAILFIIWVFDEMIADFHRTLRRGQRLQRKIKRLGGVR